MRLNAMQYRLQLLMSHRLEPYHLYRLGQTSHHSLSGDVESAMTRVGN